MKSQIEKQLEYIILETYKENKKRYGAPKIQKIIEKIGIKVKYEVSSKAYEKTGYSINNNEKIQKLQVKKKKKNRFIIKALENACVNVKETKGIIFHSDLDVQYTSKEFNDLLKQKGIKHSYSNKGTPYDNAKIESFHSILKREEIYVNNYKTFEEARIKIFEYLESFYNRKRIHSRLNYMTPQEKEDETLRKRVEKI